MNSILRPNAYFPDMTQFQKMAASGAIVWPGDGSLTTNPIHGADMGAVCVEAASPCHQEIDAGGPSLFLQRTVHAIIKPLKARIADMLDFVIAINEIDNAAPCYGEHHMKDFFEESGGKNVSEK